MECETTAGSCGVKNTIDKALHSNHDTTYSCQSNGIEDWFIIVSFGGVYIQAMINSGFSANVLSKSTWDMPKEKKPKHHPGYRKRDSTPMVVKSH